MEWKTKGRLTGTSFQYQRVGHCQKEVTKHERGKEGGEKAGTDTNQDSKVDLEKKNRSPKEKERHFEQGADLKQVYAVSFCCLCVCLLPMAEQAVVHYSAEIHQSGFLLTVLSVFDLAAQK